MIKAGEELLKLQKENQELKAKVYALSSQIISLEQDKIDLTNEIKDLKEGIAKAREEMKECSIQITLHGEEYFMGKSEVDFVSLKTVCMFLDKLIESEG